MLSKKETIKKIYEDILKDKRTFDRLRSELNSHSQFDESFIRKHILPLAQKIGPEITWQDILAYEKDALNQPAKLNLNDLQNISGGRASNVLLSCGLLALMGFSGVASNVASADFISFTETKEYQDYKAFKDNPSPTEDEQKKYEFVTLGEVPFYLQADHMVDGLLWFKHPTENKAFFVMDRHFNDKKEAVYTYSSDGPSQLNLTEKSIDKPSFEDIQKLEFRLINIDKIDKDLKRLLGETDQQKLVKYLKESFNDAEIKSFKDKGFAKPQSLQLADDNPLYNFARFYNENFTFSSDYKQKTDDTGRHNLNVPMYAKQAKEAFSKVEWDEKIQNNPSILAQAEDLKKEFINSTTWEISHVTPMRTVDTVGQKYSLPDFKTIESHITLTKNAFKYKSSTQTNDVSHLRNDGFVFFSLQTSPNRFRAFDDKNLAETSLEFKDIPLVSCSNDMLRRLDGSLSFETPCFNGSSEEIKEQIAIHHLNPKIKKLIKENKLISLSKEEKDKIFDSIRSSIKTFEVRIPTHVAVAKWEKVK